MSSISDFHKRQTGHLIISHLICAGQSDQLHIDCEEYLEDQSTSQRTEKRLEKLISEAMEELIDHEET